MSKLRLVVSAPFERAGVVVRRWLTPARALRIVREATRRAK